MIRLLAVLIAAGCVASVIVWLAGAQGGLDLVVNSYELHMSVGAAAGLLFVTVLVLLLLLRFAVALFAAPGKLRVWARTRRARQGFHAVSRGLVAAAAGDGEDARRLADHGEKLLGNAPLSLLLSAQSATLDANEKKQRAAYRAMLDQPDTTLLGLRGLYEQAMRKGDSTAARDFAARAFDLRPKAAWAAQGLFDLHVAHHEWDQAQSVLKKQLRARLLGADTARRRRAVVLTAAARDADRAGDEDGAMARALEAATLAPALVPAATLAARKLTQAGRAWKAQDVIEAAWAQSPHPDLAAAYGAIHPTDDAATRAARMGGLVQANPNATESRLLAAEQAIALHQWFDARSALEPLTQNFPTARACVLMAEIALAERGDTTAAQGWLARAARAPRDAQWRCARCSFVVQDWAPLCANCGAFDTLSWTAPRDSVAENADTIPLAPPPSAAHPRAAGRHGYAALRPGELPPTRPRAPDDPGAAPAEASDDGSEMYGDEPSPEGAVRRRAP